MASKNNPKARKKDIVVQDMNGEVLVYDLRENKAFCLNETSALVWQLCDGNNSVSEISQSVNRKMNSAVTEDFVWLALEGLKKENLLDGDGQEIPTVFDGLSRREAIKKVGLGTMIALPVISSLVAPTAAMAQSATACVPAGTSCGTSPFVVCCGTGPFNCEGAGIPCPPVPA